MIPRSALVSIGTVCGKATLHTCAAAWLVAAALACPRPDYLKWSEPENLDFGSTPPEELYWNTALPYFRTPHIYLGFPMRLVFYTDPSKGKRTDRTDCILLISRDGLHFDRRYMEAFFRPGLDPRKWESHANMMALGILSTEEGEVSMYLTNNAGGRPPHLRRLVLRTDGFASLSASYAGGEFTTRPLVFAGNQLILNVSTFAAGSLQVEVQDTSGSPFPGFAASGLPRNHRG